MTTSEEFGNAIKELRYTKQYSVRQMALRAGMTPSYLSQIENGYHNIPKVETLKKIAKGLNVPDNQIFELAGIAVNGSSDKVVPSNAIPFRIDHNSVNLPIYGRISAGYPEGAKEDVDGNINVNSSLINKYGEDNLLALRIDGESMNKIAPNGSVAILAKVDTADLKNGDVCGVIINGDSATIKHVYRYPDHIRFEPDSWLSDFKAYEYKKIDVENNEPPIQFIGKLVQVVTEFYK
ncbi:LexA family protein [Convivina intestini]|uniref:LexA family protein n=1 Tax=Convivina intestini TaxID=1505726 RepID=UPI00200C14D7|nr:S24 family peptidase [Convivina intestini]CAH1853133.1 LexA repressor [Convivina intestini]